MTKVKMKRLIILDYKDYSKVTGFLNKEGITFGNESKWYFHFQTFVITFIGTGILLGLVWFVFN